MSQFFDSDLQLLMDQLRQNEANSFSWEELAKLAKTNFMEKRNPLDSEDRSRIQRGLEFLKRDLKVCNFKDLCDVLSSICARLNLKFCVSPASACGDLIPATAAAQFLSISDVGESFGLKITPSPTNNSETLVEKAQIFFADKSCQSLNSFCKLLNQRSLNRAEEYLSELSSRFSFNDQKDVNLHIFQALKSLEHQLESYDKSKPVFELVNNKDTGLFQPGSDGSFGSLHFSVHPREMINASKRDFWAPTVDEFFQHPRGFWAEIGVERSAENAEFVLQCGLKNEKQNLPANFSLSFNKPIVLSIDMIAKLTEITGFEPSKTHPEPKNALESFGTEIFVPFKDQNQKYNFEFSKSNPNLQSFACSSLKFTNFSTLAPILKILRSSLNYFGALRSLEDYSRMEIENFKEEEDEEDQFFPFLISSSEFGKLEVLFQNPILEKKGFIGAKFTIGSSICDTDVEVRTVGESKMTGLSEIARKNMRQFLCICLTMRSVVKRLVGTENAPTSLSKKRKFANVR